MNAILIFVKLIEGIIVKEMIDINQTKKFHLDHKTTIITMSGVGLKNCYKERNKNNEYNNREEKDLNDSLSNFGQFIGIVKVRDGFIAITSNAKIYHLKFNYNYIHEIFSFPNFKNQLIKQYNVTQFIDGELQFDRLIVIFETNLRSCFNKNFDSCFQCCYQFVCQLWDVWRRLNKEMRMRSLRVKRKKLKLQSNIIHIQKQKLEVNE